MTKPGETITVVDDEGLPHDFTLVEVVEIDDRRYAVLQPDDLEAGAVVFRVEGETMTPVHDDEEFDQVVDALRNLEEYDDLVVEDGHEDDEDDEDDDDAVDEGLGEEPDDEREDDPDEDDEEDDDE